ncbi:hypothetical protein KKE06_05255 [Candidatus Micrarchaeota archaeon]|nr:hypothetical protein [Candidatus Micrarchaeota archaeon]MBU1929947.1 hypothetical protein [Candidatus Micrarchaeota archaeon]
MVLEEVPNLLGQATGDAANSLGQTAQNFLGDPSILIIGIVFIVVTVVILYFLKHIIVNSILGVVGWAILYYVFDVQLPFWASLIVSLIFGLAGLGAMLVLRFLGVV